MRRKIMLMMMLGYLAKGLAASTEFEQTFQQGLTAGKNANSAAQQLSKNFQAETVFSSFSKTPTQTHYYEGVTQTSANALQEAATHDATVAKLQDDTISNLLSRPQYMLSASDPGLQHSIHIESKADAIVHGMTDHYIDCQAKPACQVRYDLRQCYQPLPKHIFHCQQQLVVMAHTSESMMQTIEINLQVLPWEAWDYQIGIEMSLLTGQAKIHQGVIAQATVTPLLQQVNCPGISVELLKSENNFMPLAGRFVINESPSCQNHFQLKATFINFPRVPGVLSANLSYRITTDQPPVMNEYWRNECSTLDSLVASGACYLQQAATCIQGKSTRKINGIAITRDCWLKQSYYRCGENASPQHCHFLPVEHCEQIGSTCELKAGQLCLSYQQTYRCPQNFCQNTGEVVCGDGRDYCLDGHCVDHHYLPSQDFEKGVSALSATAEASKSFDQHFIFKGKVKRCRDDAGDFSNCCHERGWGQDWHLAHCSEEEKSLGVNRQQKLAIRVGRYCAHHLAWPLEHVCLEHKESYCVFDSKLSKIIQEQGRQGQLGIGFGDSEEPDCSGLTPEQLQHIDLAKINFNDFYDDLKQKLKTPNLSKISEMISQHIQQQQQSGLSHE